MRGFDFLETYKKTFNAAPENEFVEQKSTVSKPDEVQNADEPDNNHEEPKMSLTEKIKM
jgi:hypothetical protein